MAMPMAACVNAAMKRCWLRAASRWAPETSASCATRSASWCARLMRSSSTSPKATPAEMTITTDPKRSAFRCTSPAMKAEPR
jgi:hypothetical protein